METSQVPQQQVPDPMDDLPEAVYEDVEGLSWLGYIEDEFDFAGHRFVIRTLKGDDELHAAAVTAEYRNTIGEAKAWIWAQLGLSLIAIDGDPDFCPPLGHNKRDYARARFQWVSTRWHWPTAEFLYAKYTALLARQVAVIEAAQDLSSGSLPDFWPSADSLTAPGTSSDPT